MANSIISAVQSLQSSANLTKRRAAVVAHDGFEAVDTWVAIRPPLFVLGLLGLAGAGMMLWLRRKKGGEALALWGAGFAASGMLAWTCRPPEDTVAQGSALDETEKYLDSRAAVLDKAEPGWMDVAINRMMG